MSIRQYIGARYVPRFSDVNNGNWSSVYSYEPLIIVKNGNDYYTSKKSVPVGVQITDTEYWIKTGDYNGAISGLDARVSALEGNITDITDDVEELQDDVAPLVNDVYVMIGDSFGTRTGGWINYIKNKLGLTEGSNVFSSAVGGSGWCNPNTFLYQLNQLSGSMSSANKSKVTKVVTVGGVNDTYGTYTQAAIASAVSEYLNRVKELFPNLKKIYVAYNCTFVNPFISENVTRKALQTRSRAGIIDGIIASQKKVAFIGGLDNLLNNTAYVDMTDGVHPSEAGEYAIGQYILNAMNGGSNVINSRTTVHNITYAFNEGGVRIALNQGDIYNGSAINVAANSYTDLYTNLSDLPYYTRGDIFIPCVPVVLVDASNANHSITAIIRISKDGSVMILSPSAVNNVVRVSISGNYSTTDYYN